MPDEARPHGIDTLLVHAGRAPEQHHGIVNPPVYHCSTVLFDSLEQLLETRRDRASGEFVGFTYGREGTPTTRALDGAGRRLSGGHHILRPGGNCRLSHGFPARRRPFAHRG
jgi:cystathionine beta-lyase